MENLMMNCECAGEFQVLVSKEEFVKLLKIFLSLSDTFKMPALNETISDYLQLIH